MRLLRKSSRSRLRPDTSLVMLALQVDGHIWLTPAMSDSICKHLEKHNCITCKSQLIHLTGGAEDNLRVDLVCYYTVQTCPVALWVGSLKISVLCNFSFNQLGCIPDEQKPLLIR